MSQKKQASDVINAGKAREARRQKSAERKTGALKLSEMGFSVQDIASVLEVHITTVYLYLRGAE